MLHMSREELLKQQARTKTRKAKGNESHQVLNTEQYPYDLYIASRLYL